MDELIVAIRSEIEDPIDYLIGYMNYLHSKKHKSNNFIRHCVMAARIFLESQKITINDREYKRIRFPRKEEYEKYPISKNEIRELLNSCQSIWLKTFLLVLAATGARPIEVCSIRHKDIDFSNEPPKIHFRAEFTKMRNARYTYLTSEATNAIKELIRYKHRDRTIKRYDYDKNNDGRKWQAIEVKPKIRPDDLLFSAYRRDEAQLIPKVKSHYCIYHQNFSDLRNTTDTNEKAEYQNMNKITFYSLRRWVKSTISDLGYSDFSEWFEGRAGSTYYRRKEEERIQIFKKVETYITFLNFEELEVRGADAQTKIDLLQEEIRKLKAINELRTNALNNRERLTEIFERKLIELTERIRLLEGRPEEPLPTDEQIRAIIDPIPPKDIERFKREEQDRKIRNAELKQRRK